MAKQSHPSALKPCLKNLVALWNLGHDISITRLEPGGETPLPMFVCTATVELGSLTGTVYGKQKSTVAEAVAWTLMEARGRMAGACSEAGMREFLGHGVEQREIEGRKNGQSA